MLRVITEKHVRPVRFRDKLASFKESLGQKVNVRKLFLSCTGKIRWLIIVHLDRSIDKITCHAHWSGAVLRYGGQRARIVWSIKMWFGSNVVVTAVVSGWRINCSSATCSLPKSKSQLILFRFYCAIVHITRVFQVHQRWCNCNISRSLCNLLV